MAFSFSPGRSGIHSADVSGFWSYFYLRRGKSTQVNTSVCFSWARCFCSLIKVLRSRLRSLGNYKIWVNFLYYGTSYNKEDEHMLWALRCLSRELFDKIYLISDHIKSYLREGYAGRIVNAQSKLTCLLPTFQRILNPLVSSMQSSA